MAEDFISNQWHKEHKVAVLTNTKSRFIRLKNENNKYVYFDSSKNAILHDDYGVNVNICR
jgi:hypothetical protein